MKTPLYLSALLLIGATAFSACSNEEDDLFSESAAERLNQAQTKYSEIFTSSPGGWVMEYYPTYDSIGADNETDFRAVGYLLTERFNADGSVTAGMNNVFSNNQYLEATSLWDIITDNGPVLSFSSYSPVLHAFANPDNSSAAISGSADVTGLGAEGDFEFVLTDVEPDSITATVKGKKRGTYIRMTRLPEGTDFRQYIAQCDSIRQHVFGASTFSAPVLTVGSSQFVVSAPSKASTPDLWPYRGDKILIDYRRPFLITKRNGDYYLRFKSSFALGNTSVREMRYVPSEERFVGVDQTEDAQATITPQNPNRFVGYRLTEDQGRILINGSTAKSNAFQALYDNLATGMRSRRMTLNNIFVQQVDSAAHIGIRYRANNRQSTIYYTCTVSATDDAVTIAYVGAENSAGENMLTQVEALRPLLEAICSSLQTQPALTPWNLQQVRLVSTADSNMWFEVQVN